eukprot:1210674-Pyramimonas_sp.AAC.1
MPRAILADALEVCAWRHGPRGRDTMRLRGASADQPPGPRPCGYRGRFLPRVSRAERIRATAYSRGAGEGSLFVGEGLGVP